MLQDKVEMAVGSKLDIFLPETNYSFSGEVVEINSNNEDSTVGIQFIDDNSGELFYKQIQKENLV